MVVMPVASSLAACPLGNAGGQIKAVLLLPDLGTVIAPAAKIAGRTRHWPGGGPLLHEVFQALTRRPRVRGIFLQAEAEPRAGAELDMRILRGMTLNALKEIGIKNQLEHMSGSGLAFQLGIHDLVGELAELGRQRHPLQEVRIAAPHAALERTLEDNVGPPPQDIPGCVRRFLEWNAFRLDTDNFSALRIKACEIGGLVHAAVALQKGGILGVLGRLRSSTIEMGQVEARCVRTVHETASGPKPTDGSRHHPASLADLRHWTHSAR